MSSKDPSRLPHEKGFHISWDQIHRDSRALAWRLDGQGPDDGAWRAGLNVGEIDVLGRRAGLKLGPETRRCTGGISKKKYI